MNESTAQLVLSFKTIHATSTSLLPRDKILLSWSSQTPFHKISSIHVEYLYQYIIVPMYSIALAYCPRESQIYFCEANQIRSILVFLLIASLLLTSGCTKMISIICSLITHKKLQHRCTYVHIPIHTNNNEDEKISKNLKYIIILVYT
jgi:hypothetical protein